MIGVDTNVLLRLFVRDDPDQHDLARAWFQERSPADPGFVCLTVLLEFVWSLRRTYRYGRADIHRMVDGLLATDDMRIERRDVIYEAIRLASQERGDFADLIVALTNQAEGCPFTVTFDRPAARRLPSMKLLA